MISNPHNHPVASCALNVDLPSLVHSGRPGAAVGVAIIGGSKKCTWANPAFCQLTGYGQNELHKISWDNLVLPGGHPHDMEEQKQFLAGMGHDTYCAEKQLMRKDGSIFDARLSCHMLPVTAPSPQEVLLIVQSGVSSKYADCDRLNLEIQEGKLENYGILSAALLHDFNNILQGIVGFSDLALTDLPSGVAPLREYLDAIQSASRRAAALTDKMMQYSKKDVFMRQNLHPADLAHEVYHSFQPGIPHEIVLHQEVEEKLPSISASHDLLRHALYNLLVNSVESILEKKKSSSSFGVMNPVGTITLRVGTQHSDPSLQRLPDMVNNLPEGACVFFEVADTGTGMEEKMLNSIFDPSFSTRGTGHGLGLATVRNIAEGHSGHVKVWSKPGHGTAVRLLFPALKEKTQAHEKEMESRPPLVPPLKGIVLGGAAPVVLVVDDDEGVRAVGKRILERAGFRVLTASDGQEALNVFEQHAPEVAVVLLDYAMPGMDGEQTLRNLRNIRSDVRVILSSGYSKQQIFERFADQEADGFIQKPYPVTRLIDEIKKALENVKE
ncbi:TPA: hypothetical protein DDW35_09725 [Candidatus Sumerlaeota bacterium]|nr:hypothetical protein [Candidatus Sumerlaeota bacterium]